MTDREVPRTLTHESFSAVANETRLDILEALWMHGDATYTELYDRTELEDTGQFTYHLNQLVGQFVHKSKELYKLTNVGREIVMTVLTSVDGENPLRSPITLDVSCHSCGADILARCRGDWLRIDCADCEKLYASYPVPRAGLHGRDGEAVLTVFDQRLRRMNALVHRGICPNCACSMDRSVVPDAEPEPGLPFVFFHRCSHCRMEVYTVPATGLLEHPAVIAFYHDRGSDLFAIPHWELDWMFDGRAIDVTAESTLEYTVTIEVEDERLRATLDEKGHTRTIEAVD